MSDPIETTPEPGLIASVIGLVTVFVGALAGLWRTVFGTRKERAEEQRDEDSASERAADLAIKMADRAEADTRSYRTQLGTCEERLAAMDTRLGAMEARLRVAERDHAPCAARIAHLEDEQRRASAMLRDLMRTGGSTPPSGLYVPGDVLAAMEDDHG